MGLGPWGGDQKLNPKSSTNMGAFATKQIKYEERGSTESSTARKFKIPNKADKGPMGFGLIPSAKAFLRTAFMKRFLTKLYRAEIKKQIETGPQCWTAVSHTDPKDRETSTMNVAMPDFSAEYWCTYIPTSKFPVFKFRFPTWANYAALTIYDATGMPIASINLNDSLSLSPSSSFQRLPDGTCIANMGGQLAKKKGLICAIFRVYRPAGVAITPEHDMPKVYLIERREAKAFDIIKKLDGIEPLPPAGRDLARARGKVIGGTFMAMIQKYLKPLAPHQQGTQFYHPNNVAGLFVNANATYVICFLPPHKAVARVTGRVPREEGWRTYYGIMAVEYESTVTTGCLSFEELGGWGEEFEVYLTDGGEGKAREAGYKEGGKGHFLMDWGGRDGNVGVVLRFLHYFEKEAEEERGKLHALDGREGVLGIPGLAKVEYF
ncbi:hypothetical protein TrRE_jg8582 [Triparma retinervis]|uniref:Uncharacterized protein n=1 Tax=Triparma retinervis TaxID=2557542 RepID=A0A9W6ZBH2_9STRA|nr:hypothetical protein TrRE_jg8582 [Triparma retinervis]